MKFLAIELAAIILFMFGMREAAKNGRARILEFVMIFFYGIILEELDMRFFKSYRYSANFFLSIGRVPVCIAFLWAVILAGCMAISDSLGIPETAKPFLDALLAVWIDLSVDAIAIRMDFWSWAIPRNQGWFGVPAGNLYAWMWVAFFYSVFARAVRILAAKDRRWVWAYFAVPFFSYAGLFAQINLLGFAGKLFGLSSQKGRLVLFAVQFFIFCFIVGLSSPQVLSGDPRLGPRLKISGMTEDAGFWMAGRFIIHFYFLICFFLFGIYRETPLLGPVAVLILAGEIFLAMMLPKRNIA